MMTNEVTFANSLGEHLAPLLLLIRSTGFFEAYVFIPTMTLLAIIIFRKLLRVCKAHPVFLTSYFCLCFIMTNTAAVALKTLIIEEMDYVSQVWFAHLVSPLHIFIVSVTGAFLWLIWRNAKGLVDRALCIYVQVGLLGGFSVAVYRLLNEPFELTNVTTGLGALILIGLFAILNADLIMRFRNTFCAESGELQLTEQSNLK